MARLVVEVNQDKTDPADIIESLRNILSNLHYDTKQCELCDYVAHVDEMFTCADCNISICQHCIDLKVSPDTLIVCSECYKSRDKASSSDEDESATE